MEKNRPSILLNKIPFSDQFSYDVHNYIYSSVLEWNLNLALLDSIKQFLYTHFICYACIAKVTIASKINA